MTAGPAVSRFPQTEQVEVASLVKVEARVSHQCRLKYHLLTYSIDYAQPTGQFDGPRPTGMPTPGDDSSDNQDLAAGPQDPPYPKGKSPTDGPEGVARPTGKRGRKHRGGKKHRSGGVAAPTGVPPPPPPSDALPTGMPSASPPSPEKRQNRMTNGARLRSRKHKKPSKTPGAGVAPPSGARPTGARPSKAKPTKAKPSKTKGSGKSMEPTVTPPAELPRRRDSGNAEAHQPLAVALL